MMFRNPHDCLGSLIKNWLRYSWLKARLNFQRSNKIESKLDLTSYNSVKTLLNWACKGCFGNLMTSRFQNCDWVSNLIKIWCKIKAVYCTSWVCYPILGSYALEQPEMLRSPDSKHKFCTPFQCTSIAYLVTVRLSSWEMLSIH